MRVIGYLRVSTTEQADSGAGIGAQRAAIESEAIRRGWDVDWMEDAGYSAKSLERPGMVDSLDRLRSGEAKVLCVSRLDRLSRSMLDFSSLMDRAQREGWSIVALDLGVDTTTAEGEMLANIRATFAAYERRLISQRTKEALAIKRSQGIRLGRPPTIGDDVAAVARSFRSQGLSLRKIATELEQAGHVPPNGIRWYPATINALVARPA